MILIARQHTKPKMVRLDASTVCQLKCPSCPTATGKTGRNIGSGFLSFTDFKKFIRANCYVSHIELSNWGEIFLNKELIKIFQYAYQHNVFLYVINGSNFNHVREDVIEALVKYKIQKVTCSIDGASQETYEQYRVKGNFNNVIANIKKLNYWKAKYRSEYPKLIWQFVAFGHNEHEIMKARAMAEELDMEFQLKLSWGELYDLPDFSPIKNKELVRNESGTGASSRKEHKEKLGKDYIERACCMELFSTPQVNYDGRVLGCPINYWGDFGNAFKEGLEESLNGEKINYAKDMLMGKREAKEGIPCTTCKVYKGIKNSGSWITEDEVKEKYMRGRIFHMFENKILGKARSIWLSVLFYRVKNLPREMTKAVKEGRLNARFLSSIIPEMKTEKVRILPNKGYPLSIPLAFDENKKWKPYFLFRGETKGIVDFACHASVLVNGHLPHPPHTHKEEEILIMLSGEAELLLPGHHTQDGKNLHLKTGEFVYYPPGFLHTLQTVSEEPANYLMFKWHALKTKNNGQELAFGKYKIEDYFNNENNEGLNIRTLFEGPSKCLSRFQAHASMLAPGASYKPHRDLYDVVIIVLSGQVRTLGQIFEPHSVIFHPAGKIHGMSNPGKIPAQYLVFEFETR